jgi:hypothetical protein
MIPASITKIASTETHILLVAHRTLYAVSSTPGTSPVTSTLFPSRILALTVSQLSLTVTTDAKRIYKLSIDPTQWPVTHTPALTIPKRCQVALTLGNEVLVGDKAGDVIRYTITDPSSETIAAVPEVAPVAVVSESAEAKEVKGDARKEEVSPGRLLVGHVSILTDMVQPLNPARYP